MSTINEQLDSLKTEALSSLNNIINKEELMMWRTKYTGRSSALSSILKNLKDVPQEKRKEIGLLVNDIKKNLELLFKDKDASFDNKIANEIDRNIDISLPGLPVRNGSLHPITIALNKTLKVLSQLGFSSIEGPEAETSHYNFDSLRIPDDHPARDMWDTFWLDSSFNNEELLLRTHTSPMQIRFLEENDPPIRIAVPGKCYRYESTDATHEWMMHQVEILAIDKNVSIANLKATLQSFAYEMFGSDAKIMLRNSYFPFVEPGVEMAVFFRGEWLEVMGAGMVHPDIISAAGYDPNVYSGFAAGMGIERIAMLLWDIDDIRYFYQNDLRFLKKFKN
ncbi:MAG: phenylalanyl-tRNA synthetase alpha chain [Chloroflexi bacterium]|jgi:phenylalanyl-tRNA synthetase alpha chain|nr:MAG: phenylalanyl-tRNA synthetase alpha chain [Chloroflexota bacterium]|tara:strand:+ start:219 stop:1226 length:1008 start_codon:yes stop_codon:yes gene_type:complete